MKKTAASRSDTLWESFSHTGKVGAYLTYRAVRSLEETEKGGAR